MPTPYGEFLDVNGYFYDLPAEQFQSLESLDAGTVMYFTNNIASLAKNNLRHFVDSPVYRPANINQVTGPWTADFLSNNGYNSKLDIESIENPAAQPTNQQISWDRRTGVCFGPFPLVVDRENDGVLTVRNVVVRVRMKFGSGGGSFVYAALTAGNPGSPAFSTTNILAIDRFDGTPTGVGGGGAGGTGTVSFLLKSEQGLLTNPPGRFSGTMDGRSSRMLEGYIWVGWAPFQNNTVEQSVGAAHVTAYETRQETLTTPALVF